MTLCLCDPVTLCLCDPVTLCLCDPVTVCLCAVVVGEGMTTSMVCHLLVVKNHFDDSPNWVLVEQLGDVSLGESHPHTSTPPRPHTLTPLCPHTLTLSQSESWRTMKA